MNERYKKDELALCNLLQKQDGKFRRIAPLEDGESLCEYCFQRKEKPVLTVPKRKRKRRTNLELTKDVCCSNCHRKYATFHSCLQHFKIKHPNLSPEMLENFHDKSNDKVMDVPIDNVKFEQTQQLSSNEYKVKLSPTGAAFATSSVVAPQLLSTPKCANNQRPASCFPLKPASIPSECGNNCGHQCIIKEGATPGMIRNVTSFVSYGPIHPSFRGWAYDFPHPNYRGQTIRVIIQPYQPTQLINQEMPCFVRNVNVCPYFPRLDERLNSKVTTENSSHLNSNN
ncbi:uncharacterized protein LOC135146153 [Zophobas morio]|jgi:hypothetical protein|uniref:uncharacterized protein LOC135146153 n=1 Tax=Zophobas morio TaxID=2755281 RepID=UPI0030838D8D